MKTYTVEQIEDDLNDLKLRIAKMNARRNAQINLLQKNFDNGMYQNGIYRKYYNKYLPYDYYYPPLSYYGKHSSLDDLLDKYYYEPESSLRKSVSFLSEKDIPKTYEVLERKAHYDVLSKLKQFVLDQEREISGRFTQKLLNPTVKSKSSGSGAFSSKRIYKNNMLQSTTASDSFKKDNPLFLNPINRKDNFYQKYNTFVKRILKPFRKSSPSEAYKSKSNNFGSTYDKYTPPKRYYPRISRPLSPLKSSFDDLSTTPLYLRPWYRYSPMYRNLLREYDYLPKTASYLSSKDIDNLVRDIEFENRRTYPYLKSSADLPTTGYSSKYDPYESDSYIRSSLPTWKQYYYTQKLRSKPSNERYLDNYDPYHEFFLDAASLDSDDLLSLPATTKIGSDTNSLPDEDWQIIDDYRELIFDDIIRNLRKQQAKNYSRSKVSDYLRDRTRKPFYSSAILKNDRSLYNYRIPDTNLGHNYAWNKKPDDETKKDLDYSADKTPSIKSKYSYLQNRNNDLSTSNLLATKEIEPTSGNYDISSLTRTKALAETKTNTSPYEFEGSPSRFSENIRTSPSKYSSILQEITNAKPTATETEYNKEKELSPKSTPTESFFTRKLKDEEIAKPSPPSFSRRSSVLSVTKQPIVEQVNSNKHFTNTNQLSPKKQCLRPISPGKQPVDENSAATAPAPLSRKNSVQHHPIRKGSIQKSSIEEEPTLAPKTDLGRRYSIKDPNTHYSPTKDSVKGTVPYSPNEKHFSFASNGDRGFDEKQEAEMKENDGSGDYTTFKDDLNRTINEPILPSSDYDNSYQPRAASNYPIQNQYPLPSNQCQQPFQNLEKTSRPRTAYYENEPPAPEDETYNQQKPLTIPYDDQRYYEENQYNRKGSSTSAYQPYDAHYTDCDYNPQYQQHEPETLHQEKPDAPYSETAPAYNMYNENEYTNAPNQYATDYQNAATDYYENRNQNGRYNQNYPTNESAYPNTPAAANYYYESGSGGNYPPSDYRDDPNQYKGYENPPQTSLENYSLNSSAEKDSNNPSYSENYNYSGQQSLENQYTDNDRVKKQGSSETESASIKETTSENVSLTETAPGPAQVAEERKRSVENDTEPAVKERERENPPQQPEPVVKEPPPPTRRTVSRNPVVTTDESKSSTATKVDKTPAEKARLARIKPIESKFKRVASMQKKTIPKRP